MDLYGWVGKLNGLWFGGEHGCSLVQVFNLWKGLGREENDLGWKSFKNGQKQRNLGRLLTLGVRTVGFWHPDARRQCLRAPGLVSGIRTPGFRRPEAWNLQGAY